MRYLILSFLVLFSCGEIEQLKVAVGCECNNGNKLNFSEKIVPEDPNSPTYTDKHCSCVTPCVYYYCGVTTMIIDQRGFKRFIYDPSELN